MPEYRTIVDQYAFMIIGLGFSAFSLHKYLSGGEIYAFIGVMSGLMIVFLQADRNVYYNRLNSLISEINKIDEISAERVRYESYEVEIEDSE